MSKLGEIGWADEKALLAAFPNGLPEVDSSCACDDEPCESSVVDEVMGEILGKLMLHKPETRHVEKIVRPIIEKLMVQRDFAYGSWNRWMDKFIKEFDRARKLEQELNALKGGQG